MQKQKEYRIVAGIQIEIQNYEGVLLEKSPLTGNWFLYYKDNVQSPLVANLAQIKVLVDDFKKQNRLIELKQY